MGFEHLVVLLSVRKGRGGGRSQKKWKKEEEEEEEGLQSVKGVYTSLKYTAQRSGR